MKHTLTVTIPSYRQPAQLDRALHALSLQTFKDFNVVIIDDNSGIDLTPITTKFKKYLNITVLTNNKNLGAMNNMLRSITLETESTYIYSHHEDDYIKSNYLEISVRALEKNPNMSFVISSAIWVEKETSFTESSTKETEPAILTLNEFLLASLRREPFIFGSVVYRKKDTGVLFRMEEYHTLCDKIYLAEILTKHKTVCGYIKEPSIYVRDHSLDKKDERSNGATVTHLVNYYSFYKNNLIFNKKESVRLITNGLLLSYSNLPIKTSIFELLSKQRKLNLLSFRHIDFVGVYSIVSLLVGKKLSHKLLKLNFLKRLLKI